MTITLADLAHLAPMWILIATGLLLLMYEVFSDQPERTYSANIAVGGLLLALIVTARSLGDGSAHLFGAPGSAPLVVDAFSRASSMLLISGGLVAALLSPGYAKNAGHDHGEYYALMVFAVVA